MSVLAVLNIVDLRAALPPPLPRAPATGAPQGELTAVRYGVLHYNGPPAPARAGGSRDEVVGWLREVIIPNHIARLGADGVQYHLWIARDGTIYQLRDLTALLWHCGNYPVNSHSLAVHIPIGGTQTPTDVQWSRACAVFDALRAEYGVARSDIKGHKECGPSMCPGPILMAKLIDYRVGSVQPCTYRVKPGGGTLRSAPYRAPGTFIQNVPPGTEFRVAGAVPGESIAGDPLWYSVAVLQRVAYIHRSAVEAVAQ